MTSYDQRRRICVRIRSGKREGRTLVGKRVKEIRILWVKIEKVSLQGRGR
jgi:hypothetical protein